MVIPIQQGIGWTWTVSYSKFIYITLNPFSFGWLRCNLNRRIGRLSSNVDKRQYPSSWQIFFKWFRWLINVKIVYLLTSNAILAAYPQMWISGSSIYNIGISSYVDKRAMLVWSAYRHLTICGNNGPITCIKLSLYQAKQLTLFNAWDILQRTIWIIVWHAWCNVSHCIRLCAK